MGLFSLSPGGGVIEEAFFSFCARRRLIRGLFHVGVRRKEEAKKKESFFPARLTLIGTNRQKKDSCIAIASSQREPKRKGTKSPMVAQVQKTCFC